MKINYWRVKSVLGAAVLLMASAGWGAASDGDRQVIPVTLNAGDTYVIKNLGKDSTPSVHVIKNPNALVVNGGQPGQLLLVGADTGEWTLDVTDADGAQLTYKVDVHSVTNFADPTKPGKAPAALGNPSSAASKSATIMALDTGAGPVDPAEKTATAAGATTASTGTTTASAGAVTASAGAMSANAGATTTSAAASTAAPATPTFLANAPGTTPVGSTAPGSGSAGNAAPIKLAEYIPPSPSSATAAPVMPSQALSSAPVRKFSANPPAIPVSPSEAGPSGSNFLPNDVVIVSSGASRIFDFPRRIRRISLADTDVADIQVVNPFQINLIGHKEGFTTLAIWDNQGRYEERQVRVDPFGRQQVMLNAIVAEVDRGRAEQNGINWSLAFQNAGALPGVTLVNNLGGGASTPFSSTSAVNSTCPEGSSSGAVLPFGGCLAPMTLANNMTYGLALGHTAQSFFSYLESHNLGKVLSEPRLLANSGEKAEFLDGGEIPIVITQALNSTIVFKQFGTSVIFVPTVVGKDEIELSVKPEVSQPDFAHGVNLFGFTVPAFVTRRAQTLVRLHNNQTLIIAGLILKTPTSTVNKVPYLGDAPLIGNLFKNTAYDNAESELMMSVTPQIVEPVPNGGVVAQPTRGPLTAEDIRTEALPQPDASRPRF